MIPVDRDRAVSRSRPKITTQRDTPMTSRLLSMNTNSPSLSSAGGAFDPADFSDSGSDPDL